MRPSMIGLSWFGELSTSNLPPDTLSQAQPLPKRVIAAFAKSSLNFANPPKSLAIFAASSPVGSPPALGPITVQKSEWLACPPPLFRTTPRMFSGTAAKLAISSSTDFCSKSVPAMALLTLVMYAWWCFVWWISMVRASMCGSRAL